MYAFSHILPHVKLRILPATPNTHLSGAPLQSGPTSNSHQPEGNATPCFSSYTLFQISPLPMLTVRLLQASGIFYLITFATDGGPDDGPKYNTFLPCFQSAWKETVVLTCLTMSHHYPQLILCRGEQVIGLCIPQRDLG